MKKNIFLAILFAFCVLLTSCEKKDEVSNKENDFPQFMNSLLGLSESNAAQKIADKGFETTKYENEYRKGNYYLFIDVSNGAVVTVSCVYQSAKNETDLLVRWVTSAANAIPKHSFYAEVRTGKSSYEVFTNANDCVKYIKKMQDEPEFSGDVEITDLTNENHFFGFEFEYDRNSDELVFDIVLYVTNKY